MTQAERYTCRWCKVDPIKGKGSLLRMCSACYELDVCSGCGKRDGERVTKNGCFECFGKKKAAAGTSESPSACPKCSYFCEPGLPCGRCGPEVQTYPLVQFGRSYLDSGRLESISFEYSSLYPLEGKIGGPNSYDQLMLPAQPRGNYVLSVRGYAGFLDTRTDLVFTCERWNQFKIFPTFPVTTGGAYGASNIDRQKLTIDPPPTYFNRTILQRSDPSSLGAEIRVMIDQQQMKLDPPVVVEPPAPKLPPLVDLNPRRRINFNDE